MRKIEQDEPTDEGVEALIGLEGREIGLLEAPVGDTESGGSAASSLYRRCSAVDPEYGTLWSHEPGGEQRHIAHPATALEHRHALSRPRAAKPALQSAPRTGFIASLRRDDAECGDRVMYCTATRERRD